jgi:hypothetical protein
MILCIVSDLDNLFGKEELKSLILIASLDLFALYGFPKKL